MGKNSRASHPFIHKSYFARDCLEFRVISSALSYRAFVAYSRALLCSSLAMRLIHLIWRPLLYGEIEENLSHQATEMIPAILVMTDSDFRRTMV